MTTVNIYCMDADHASRSGEEGWTDEPTLILTFEGEPPPDPAAGYLSLCGACARVSPGAAVPDGG